MTNQVFCKDLIEGLTQVCSVSSAIALEILQSCTKQWKWRVAVCLCSSIKLAISLMVLCNPEKEISWPNLCNILQNFPLPVMLLMSMPITNCLAGFTWLLWHLIPAMCSFNVKRSVDFPLWIPVGLPRAHYKSISLVKHVFILSRKWSCTY